MKSVVDEKQKSVSYPYLGIAKDRSIVLFSTLNTGILVAKGNGCNPLGFHYSMWAEANFEKFEGKVTLEN